MANIFVKDALDRGFVRLGSIGVQDDMPAFQMLFGHRVPFDLPNGPRSAYER